MPLAFGGPRSNAPRKRAGVIVSLAPMTRSNYDETREAIGARGPGRNVMRQASPFPDKFLMRSTGHLETVWSTLAQGRSTGAGLISLQLQLLEHLEDGLEYWREWEAIEPARLVPSPLSAGLFAAEALTVVLSLGTREDRSH